MHISCTCLRPIYIHSSERTRAKNKIDKMAHTNFSCKPLGVPSVDFLHHKLIKLEKWIYLFLHPVSEKTRAIAPYNYGLKV